MLQESIFNFMQGNNQQCTNNNRADKEYYNMLNTELSKQPYSFYSYALFYERGNIYDCLRSLDKTTQREIVLFVKHQPENAEKFVDEILRDELAMKLHLNYLDLENNYSSRSSRVDESFTSSDSSATQLQRVNKKMELQKLKE
jgi:hypothetical protein